MKIIFDVLHLYYLPQYLPVYKQLLKENAGEATFVFYHGIHDATIQDIIAQENLNYKWVENDVQAVEFYLQEKADWVFFANAFDHLEQVHSISKSAQLGHGIGPKASYYSKSSTPMSVRFVEGQYRTQRLNTMYPDSCFIDVGFCKLDPIVNQENTAFSLDQLGLSPHKKTLLYAPTFYPSSIERFPKHWPKDYADYNILIKPHYFSVTKESYKAQKARLGHWATFDNVYLAKVEDYSLIPFMATADILISDASSALFEFAALDKPVIWCDFLKLRWSYRGPLAYRFKRRMDQDYGEYADIATHAKTYSDLRKHIEQYIAAPDTLQSIRLSLAEKLCGKIDGKVSARIVAYLKENTP